MKMLLALCLVFASLPSFADSVVGLPTPAGTDSASYRTYCAGNSFNADGSISGACQSTISQVCSGRGCNPVQNTTVYIASWDADGAAISAIACSVTRHHAPQKDIITYLNGYTSCPAVALEPAGGTVVVIDGVPFYYVATDTATGAELINSNAHGYLYLP